MIHRLCCWYKGCRYAFLSLMIHVCNEQYRREGVGHLQPLKYASSFISHTVPRLITRYESYSLQLNMTACGNKLLLYLSFNSLAWEEPLIINNGVNRSKSVGPHGVNVLGRTSGMFSAYM